MKRSFLLITLLGFSLLFLSGCSNRQSYRRTHFYMGTTAELNVPIERKSPTEIERICDIVGLKISELSNLLSIFDESSIISKINNDNRKSLIKATPELFQLIKRAKEYFMLTQGAFDITIGPLTEIWGFGSTRDSPPNMQVVKDALSHVGSDKIELNEEAQTLAFKDPRVRIDLGGVAKGYVIDEAVKIFRRHNITNGLINIGGDLYCMGTNFGNKDWIIGIKDPKDKDGILAQLKISNKAIATSGNYENFYIYNNKKYDHIIDPRTGHLVSNDLESVTIVASDCTTADALATAVFVLGENKGLELIEKLRDTECFLVVNRGDKLEVLMSSGMQKYIK